MSGDENALKAFGTYQPVNAYTLPLSIPNGAVLVHNHLQHEKDTPSGMRGFRAWFQKSTDGLVVCECGWSGLEHYRVDRLGLAKPQGKK